MAPPPGQGQQNPWLQFGVLGTDIDETSEQQPFGTGRTFSYSDVVAGFAYSRRACSI